MSTTPCLLLGSQLRALVAAGGCDKGGVICELLRPGRIPKVQGLPGDWDVLPNGFGVEWQGRGWTSRSSGIPLGLHRLWGLQAWQRDTCSGRMSQHHTKEQQTTSLSVGLHALQGNGSFSNQCVFRIWLCFCCVFMIEQAPHLYLRAIPAVFLRCLQFESLWRPFLGL